MLESGIEAQHPSGLALGELVTLGVGGRNDPEKALQGGLQFLQSLSLILLRSQRGIGEGSFQGEPEAGHRAASQEKQLFSIGLKAKPGNVPESAEAASSALLRGQPWRPSSSLNIPSASLCPYTCRHTDAGLGGWSRRFRPPLHLPKPHGLSSPGCSAVIRFCLSKRPAAHCFECITPKASSTAQAALTLPRVQSLAGVAVEFLRHSFPDMHFLLV